MTLRFRQGPGGLTKEAIAFAHFATKIHLPMLAQKVPAASQEKVRDKSAMRREICAELFRSAYRRTEITQLVVDLIFSAYGSGNFFVEQSAITLTQPVHQIFHCRFLKAKDFRKICVRYLFPIGSKVTAKDIKNASSAVFFAFVAQSPQRALDHCFSPAYIENSFRRPIARFLFGN